MATGDTPAAGRGTGRRGTDTNRKLLFACGVVAVGLWVAGIAVPLLPTPFGLGLTSPAGLLLFAVGTAVSIYVLSLATLPERPPGPPGP